MDKEDIFRFARELRKNQTPTEKLLWANLRNRKLNGFKFLRQHPILYSSFNGDNKYFIPDFYCAEKKLIIELDGKIHDFQKDYDQNREAILTDLGMKVIRFKNEDLENMKLVIKRIKEYLDEPTHPRLAAQVTPSLLAQRGGSFVKQ
ncbi:MAG: endonuclease domain-containing protein [Bacteroidales bacterium]|nr:endonuclease domain-containing protein [Bacteroidales bacterium]